MANNPGDFKPGNPTAFKKGQSGNPGGRKKGAEARARAAAEARTYTGKNGVEYTGHDALMHALLDIGFDEKEKARDRIQAVCKVREYGWGTAKQLVKIGVDTDTDDASELAPEKMSTDEIRDALGAIATLKRIGGIADGSAGDRPTEH